MFYFTKHQKMFKVLFFVIVLVAPIFGEINEGENKPAIEVDEKKLAMEAEWKEKCKNVSGVDIDVEFYLRLHEDLRNCRKNAIDTIKMRREIEFFFMNFTSGYNSNMTISDFQTYYIIKTFRKYCGKYPKYLNCRDTLIPVYDECFTHREIDGFILRDDINYRINDFFCTNYAENVYNFVTGKIIECTFANKTEVVACFDGYLKILAKKEDNSLINLYKPDIVCNAIEALKVCALPIYEQCELSPMAGDLIKALYEYVDTESLCANGTNTSS